MKNIALRNQLVQPGEKATEFIVVFNIHMRGSDGEGINLFTLLTSDRTQENMSGEV